MPNWCSTSYVFESTNRDVLKRFYDFVIKYTSDEYAIVKSGTPFTLGNMWLGNLLHGCKVEFGATDKDTEDIPCRGIITYLFTNEENEGYIFERDCQKYDDIYYLEIETDTAWKTMFEIWNFVLKYFPDIVYYYEATEPGSRIYETNDINHRYFIDDYHVFIEIDIKQHPELNSFINAFREYNCDGIIDESFPSERLQFLLEEALNIKDVTYSIDTLINKTMALFENKEDCYFDINEYTESECY